MKVDEIYYRIINAVNFFLESVGSITIDGLKEVNPSVERIAKDMRTLSNILKDLAGSSYEDQNLAINALQCCFIMEELAIAVSEEREGDFDELFRKLELHTKVP
ncbi:hypothetical protein BMR04_14870 [Methylococcaceae bacterium HT3]|nr:hypothetical protein BMR04_14870 [Methylococcaceae bacterium HT3]TXL19252.1 hypothetical protein BMR03_15395 [Methylococcaceae bacterium HT2]